MKRKPMAARDRFSKKLTCPQCGNTGFAEASEDDHPSRKNPAFRVDQLPKGFFEQKSSNFQETYIIRCECSRKFPFRALTEKTA
ncbi:hypothetical protein IE4872_CH02510 [Rhizobium gallicum]|uniref:Uncharacterized protein n=3 Tax=Rhizobium/Agrobacterium group TaxID=227290 RepID=A0A0B4X3K7_9HYPH|nr:hypothetical protein RGR602_CH02395 [Rhizobium gallicum bv. gallicum R602sp]APO68120.1 hypothetical protein IE4872_CH02510 [Rhizobium gallicum]